MTTFHPSTPMKCRPPVGTTSPNGIYFRIVVNNPPTAENFVIWIEEPFNKHRLQEMVRKGNCQAFAASMFATEEETSRKIDLFRHAWEKRRFLYGDGFLGIAQVELDSTCGMIKQTGKTSDHYALWPYGNSRLECNVISVRGV